MRAFLIFPFLPSAVICGPFRCSTDTATDTSRQHPITKKPCTDVQGRADESRLLGRAPGRVQTGRKAGGSRQATGRWRNLQDIADRSLPSALIRTRRLPCFFPYARRSAESSTATDSLNPKTCARIVKGLPCNSGARPRSPPDENIRLGSKTEKRASGKRTTLLVPHRRVAPLREPRDPSHFTLNVFPNSSSRGRV